MVLQFGTYMNKTRKVGNIEQRLFFTLSYFAVFGVISIVFLAALDAKADNLLNATQHYVTCEAFGPSPGSCDKFVQDMNKYGLYKLGGVSYTLLGLLPFIFLIFICDWSTATKIGKIVKKILQFGRQHSSDSHDNQVSAAFSTFSPAPITSVSNW